ncbi:MULTISPECIES: alpha/beta hydrolase [Cellvibrio]|uniref:Pimeloyl-ACP methyl ester carboxylesterase n=1 Tax=Cellvibrio fibrivorans TaxID=126350 RepID=A0ABU1UZ26_9GAMM|nr:alpha/beta hydrolase [Cellvibrio fibrivorans]MDR7090415.1 pimeloyl-ACP methyl ester carboxylesterase [Cellvibrio fibrivorans]
MLCKKNGGLMAVMIAVLVCMVSANQSHGETSLPIKGSLSVETKGSGPALIFIPGLNSGKETFRATCDHFQKNYQCHLLQLPGFAGHPAKPGLQQDFLIAMRDEILAYINTHKLKKLTLVGHSLGGTLSLMLTLKAPELVDKLVIVDALPFYPAIQNPALTAELMRPQAEQMRVMMNNQSQVDYEKNATANMQGMSNNPARLPLLIEWSKNSDRATTTQAMIALMTTDLRNDIAAIKQPTLVLGAWAAYKAYGSTKDSTAGIYQLQYAKLKNVDIRLSDTGYHFLTWDDGDWVNQQISEFLSAK